MSYTHFVTWYRFSSPFLCLPPSRLVFWLKKSAFFVTKCCASIYSILERFYPRWIWVDKTRRKMLYICVLPCYVWTHVLAYICFIFVFFWRWNVLRASFGTSTASSYYLIGLSCTCDTVLGCGGYFNMHFKNHIYCFSRIHSAAFIFPRELLWAAPVSQRRAGRCC